jgi:hypothetical protein
MDSTYLLSLVSFFIGVAAGFQGVHERYHRDSLVASSTPPGIFYLLSRGIVPAILFILLLAYKMIESHLILQALACGTGAELVLRTRFYVKQSQKGDDVEELSRGPFDLLRWYQSLFLESIAEFLAKSRKRFVKDLLAAGEDFQTLHKRVQDNLGAWPDQSVVTELGTALARLLAEFDTERQKQADVRVLQETYRLKLGYLLLNKVGRNGLRTLLAR